MAKKLVITWTQQTASIIANSTIGETSKGFDPEKGTTTFEEIAAIEPTPAFLFVGLADGTEYGYPNANVARIKLTDS